MHFFLKSVKFTNFNSLGFLSSKSNNYNSKFSFDQVIGTLPLILMVLSLTDPRNEISAGLTPLLVGLAIGVCHMARDSNLSFSFLS